MSTLYSQTRWSYGFDQPSPAFVARREPSALWSASSGRFAESTGSSITTTRPIRYIPFAWILLATSRGL